MRLRPLDPSNCVMPEAEFTACIRGGKEIYTELRTLLRFYGRSLLAVHYDLRGLIIAIPFE